MIKKFLVIFLSVLILCGCSRRLNSAEEIVFSSWGSVSEVGIIKRIISDFERENPDIKISFMHIPQNYFQKIHLLFASNTEPDVIFINNLYLPVYESKLTDLSSVVNTEEYYPQAIEGLSFGGRLLAVPRDVSNQIFYVNTDIVKNISRWDSLDELLNTAVKYTSNGIYGISGEEDIYWALPYINYFGGGLLDKDGRIIIGTEESRKGLEFYKELKTKYHAAPTKSQVGSLTLAQMFLEGKLGIYFSGRWLYPKISDKADFSWKVLTFPDGGRAKQKCDASGWAVAGNSKHKEAAIRFVKYLSEDKTSEYFAKSGLIVPAKVKSSELILNGNLHNEQAFLDAVKMSEKRTVSKDYQKIKDKMNRELEL